MSIVFNGNFRSTSGYVTDASDEVFVGTDVYPVVSNGYTYGYVDGHAPEGARDRLAHQDARIAGFHFVNNARVSRFQIDLPKPGSYNIHFGAADYSDNNATIDVYDDTSFLTNLLSNANITGGNAVDATGNVLSYGDWAESQASVNLNFATTAMVVYVRDGGYGFYGIISHLKVIGNVGDKEGSFNYPSYCRTRKRR